MTALASNAFGQPASADDDLEIPAAPQTTPAPGALPSTTPPSPSAAPTSSAPSAPVAPAPPADVSPPPPSTSPSTDAAAFPPVRASQEPSLTRGFTGPLGLYVSGYVQGQYETSQLSEDQLAQGGLPLNQDRFLVRRARVRLDRSWTWAQATIEIDGNTTRGPTFGLRRAEASLVYRNPDAEAPPYARLTAGLSEIPFGYELTDSARSRYFMERSTGSLALFPGEPDVGVRLSGGLGFFRYAIAAINGEPIDDRPGRISRDPNAAKDIVGRLGVDTRVAEKVRVAGGASFLTGKGFHPGTDATKNGVVWRDLNENAILDAGELTAIPATAATPSQNFGRWAFGLDLGVTLETRFGKSRVYGEVFAAQNADRGVFFADPIATGTDVREIGGYVAVLQEVTRWAIAGFRADFYDPNGDFFDKRVGKLIPADASITTFSPLVGALLPDRVRVLVQADFVRDKLARDGAGVPTDLKNDQLTIRIQGEL